MPVPVSITHAARQPVLQQTALNAELNTDGPFARLTNKKADADMDVATESTSGAVAHAAAAAETVQGSALAAQAPAAPSAPFSVCVSHLTFSYPGLGAPNHHVYNAQCHERIATLQRLVWPCIALVVMQSTCPP